jgi:RecA/RadA recombinase
MRGVARITHLLTEGHHGAMAALSAVHGAFAAAVNDPSRSGEWGRLITGAVQIAAVHQPAPFDPCISPFIAGHVPSSPLRQERTSWDTSPISASSAPVAGTPASSSTSPTPVVALAPVVSMIPETTTVGTITALPMAASAPDATPAGQPSSIGLLTPGTPARTSWWPVDLSRILNGEHAEEAPEVLRRDDGAALFYLGRVNGLIGPSESGKSWVALAACAQELLDGHHVTYLDFEDTASGVVRRVLGMGVPPDVIAERFHYIGPDESPAPEALADLTATLTEHSPRLVVLDGFNAAMSLAGLELMSNTDATVFFQRLLNPIMRSDRAIVYVDHVPKSKIDESSGGIGAQAKRAMTTGCTIRVDKKDEFGPGVTGYLKLTIDKDRMGHVREVAIGAKFAGTAVIDSAHGLMTITIEKPVSEVEVETKREARRHPDVMQQISELLAIAPEGLSKNVVRKEVTAGNPAIEAALRDLLSEGYIEQSTGSRSAIICKNVRPFRADSDIRFTAFDPTSPDLARPRPDLAPGDVPSRVSYVARPPRPDPYVVGSGGARSEPDGAGAANTENEHLAPGEVDETDLTWRDGNLVNKRTGEIVRRRA